MRIFWLEQRDIDVPSTNDWLSAREWERCCSMRVSKRRAEWRLGRWTAKLALATMYELPAQMSRLACVEIWPAPSGVPLLYLGDKHSGLAISLSHSNGRAMCVLAPEGANIGCDVESIERRTPEFIADYFTAKEQQDIERASVEDDIFFVNLMWSSKESVLKALGCGLRAELQSVTVSIDLQNPELQDGAEAWFSFSARTEGGRAFHGFWRRSGSFVYTITVDSPSAELSKLCPVTVRASVDAFQGHAI